MHIINDDEMRPCDGRNRTRARCKRDAFGIVLCAATTALKLVAGGHAQETSVDYGWKLTQQNLAPEVNV